MDDRTKTVAAVAIIIAIFVIAILSIGAIVSGRGVVSPVPQESPIKIIILSPTPQSRAASGSGNIRN